MHTTERHIPEYSNFLIDWREDHKFHIIHVIRLSNIHLFSSLFLALSRSFSQDLQLYSAVHITPWHSALGFLFPYLFSKKSINLWTGVLRNEFCLPSIPSLTHSPFLAVAFIRLLVKILLEYITSPPDFKVSGSFG